MKYCAKCIFPDTKPDLTFDEEGACDACRSAERKNQVDWSAREAEFVKVVAKYKAIAEELGSPYDCIIPVSGGKDSTFQTLKCLEYGLKPLLVSFEPTMATELGKKNLKNNNAILSGCDLIQFRKNPIPYRKMCRIAFETVGDQDYPNHVGIFTVPVHFAIMYKVPLLIWGENCQEEYGGPNEEARRTTELDANWLQEFGGLLGLRIQDFINDHDFDKRDLAPYIYPEDEDLILYGTDKQYKITGLYLGSFFKWNAYEQVKEIQNHGWKLKDSRVTGTYRNYENLDCELVSFHDYLKYVKYGFCRATDHACIDIRNGRLTRNEAIDLVNTYDGLYPIQHEKAFCSYLGMNKDEVRKVIDSFTNPDIFETNEDGGFKRQTDGVTLIKRYPVK